MCKRQKIAQNKRRDSKKRKILKPAIIYLGYLYKIINNMDKFNDLYQTCITLIDQFNINDLLN